MAPRPAECASFLPQRKMKLGAARRHHRAWVGMRLADGRRHAFAVSGVTRRARAVPARPPSGSRLCRARSHTSAAGASRVDGAATRGARPELAVRFALIEKKGRWEGRAPAGTRSPAREKRTRGRPQVTPERPAFPARMVLRLMARSPRGAMHYCPRRLADDRCAHPVGHAASPQALTHRPRASGPHAFVVRGPSSPRIPESSRVLATEAEQEALSAPGRSADAVCLRVSPPCSSSSAPALAASIASRLTSS